jgi:hypothetical protein
MIVRDFERVLATEGIIIIERFLCNAAKLGGHCRPTPL